MTATIWALAALLVVAGALAAGLASDVRRSRAAAPYQPVREPRTEPPSSADATVWRTGGAHRAAAAVGEPRPVPVSPLLHQRDWFRRFRPKPDVHVGADETFHPLEEYTAAGQSDDAAAMVAPTALAAPRTDDALQRFRGNMARSLSRFYQRNPGIEEAVKRVSQPTEGWTAQDVGELRERLAQEEVR